MTLRCGSNTVLLRRIHGVMTVVWLVLTPPGIIWLRNSVPFLMLVSLVTALEGSASAWQAARVEVKQDEASA